MHENQVKVKTRSGSTAQHKKRTPISRRESRTISNRRKLIAMIRSNNVRHPHFLQTLTAPVSSLCWLRSESHQTPVGIKLAAMLRDRPGGLYHPRETLVPSRVQWVARNPNGCRRGDDASPFVAHGLGDSAICIQSGGTKAVSNQLRWLHTSPLFWLTAFGQTVSRNIDPHRRASAPAACGSTPAPICAPAP